MIHFVLSSWRSRTLPNINDLALVAELLAEEDRVDCR